MKFYNWSPALCNAIATIVLILVNQFVPDYNDSAKAIVDALFVLISGGVTYTQVTPVAKLRAQNNAANGN